MTHLPKIKVLRRYILLCIALVLFTIPTFSDQKIETMDDLIGDYSGALSRSGKSTRVHLTIQKISSSTGLVTLEGIEDLASPLKYYMTYDPTIKVARFYPSEVATTGDLSTPYIFEGFCGNDLIAGNHAVYGLDPSSTILEENFMFFKDRPETIHLNKGILNSKIDLPNQLIHPRVNGSTLEDAKVCFYEYGLNFYSMSLSFKTSSPQDNYYYMLTLPEAVNTISVTTSDIKPSLSTYNNAFGRYMATRFSSNFYGLLSHADLKTQDILKDTYKDALLNKLDEDSVLGRIYNHYDSFYGVLSGHTYYEIEFLFSGSLESFLETLESSPASFYVGGQEGELLLDNFAPTENEWRDLLKAKDTNKTESLTLDGDYIKGVTISSDELTDLLIDSFNGIDKAPEKEILDEEEITFNKMTRDVSLMESGNYYIVAIQDPENRDNEFFGVFDHKYNLKVLTTKQNDIIIMVLYFDDKVVVCDSINNGDHYTYNEYSLVDYKLSEQLKALKDFSLSVLHKYIK